MSWATEFPEELLRKPTGFVGFTGLEIANNPTHKSIWEAFSLNRKSDRLPLHFKLEEPGHEYPPSKPKRPSYDWYIPKGLLKSGWIKKHLDVVPSLVIMFIDCDWDDPFWKSKLVECVNGVKFIRNQLNGRSTKVGLVLVQKSVSLPPGEDIIASERASSLCALCDLPNKLLFVLPITESLLGYTIRLEHAFVDFSRTYYHSEARRVKTHKDLLNKTTHALLFVRHQFKIAFYNELKQDSSTALKHYKQAYLYVQELRLLNFNLLEIKTIAGFINYKICKLSFSDKMPLDAISQFRKHVDFFKTKLGIPELNFEHTAWMSKQFQMFGDLFDEAIKQGLTAILTQHPGIYYQQAAHHAANRRSLSQATCQSVDGVLNSDFVATLHTLDYYGQRPWRQGQQSIEAPDAGKEREGILMLQLTEKQVNHSKIIIPLLGSAVTHAKRYKSPRMKRHLLVQLMNEYYLSKEYSKALLLVARATHEYRNERWWMVLTSVLSLALKCAYMVADVQQYVTVCLELVGIYSLLKRTHKSLLLDNLNSILKGGMPESEVGLSASQLVEAANSWSTVQAAEKQRLVKVDVTNIIPFVECKVQFSREVFQSDSKIEINVYIRSQTVKQWSFDRLSLTLNNETYNKFCIYDNASNDAGGLLTLQHGQINCISFSFMSLPCDVGSQLEVTSVVLEMGGFNEEEDKCSCRVVMVWTGSSVDSVTPSVCCQGNLLALSAQKRRQQEAWQALKLLPFAKVSSRKPQIALHVSRHQSAFVDEVISYQVSVSNLEHHPISNVRCNVILDPNVLPAIKNSTTLYINSNAEETIDECSPGRETHSGAQEIISDEENISRQLRNTTTITSVKPVETSAESFNFYDQNDSFFGTVFNNNINNKVADKTSKTECCEDTIMGASKDRSQFANNIQEIHNTTSKTTKNNNEDEKIYAGEYVSSLKTSGLKAMHPVMLEMGSALEVAGEVSCVFHSCTHQPGILCMLVSVTYDMVTGILGEETLSRCVQSKLLHVSVLEPVQVHVHLLNLKMERLLVEEDRPTKVDHCFLLTTSVVNLCSTSLCIKNTHLLKNVGVVVDDGDEHGSYLKGEELHAGEVATETFYLSSNAFHDQALSLGRYSVDLVRRTSENKQSQVFSKSIELPRVTISSSPLYVDLILPSFGMVHSNLFTFYSVRNMTPLVQELTISMETCDGFMFSGHKQVTVRVLPLSSIQLKYNLVPLMPGNLTLPRLHILNQQFPDFQLEHHRQTPLPSTIFVKPQPKYAK